MLKKKLIFYLCTATYFLVACSNPAFEQTQLEYALDFAGDNRGELEKVLTHYKDDSLKLKAAEFLIRNMPRCYSYQQGGDMDSVKKVRACANSFGQVDEKLLYRWRGYSYQHLPKVYDSQIITADYLIDNIDRAFENWKKRSWNRGLSFDDFCEYLLPYRVGNEPLEEWRKLYGDEYAFLLDSVYRGGDVLEAANRLSRHLLHPVFIYSDTKIDLPHVGAQHLFEYRFGNCVDAADIFTYACRSIGIPCTADIDLQGGHQWNVVRDTTGVDIPFWFFNIIATRDKLKDGGRVGKRYRQRYGVIAEKLYQMADYKESIPSVLMNPYLEDVSRYYYDDTLRLLNKDAKEGSVALLGAFSKGRWLPVAYSFWKGGVAQFNNIESDLVYFPCSYAKDNYVQVGYPFLFSKNQAREFMPIEGSKRKVRLYRKYTNNPWLIGYAKGMSGAKFEGSNDETFKKKETLYVVADSPRVAYNAVSLQQPAKYRYIRFWSSPSKRLEVAELGVFFENREVKVEKITGALPKKGEGTGRIEDIVDGSPLTCYVSEEKSAQVTLDLGREVWMDKLLFVSRNDDNFIRPGDQYELFYNAGNEGWKSLGRQLGERVYLEYEVPDNALFWLHNLTRGREEHVFFMQDGEQVFLTI